MSKVFELLPDIFGEFTAKSVTPVPERVSFLDGSRIGQDLLQLPMEFETGHSVANPPRGLLGQVIPVMSDAFVAALLAAGVSNLQCFDARLRSRTDGSVWDKYKAVNIIGLVDCADLARSDFERVLDRPGGSGSALLDFITLKVDASRAKNLSLFRLGESPGTIVVSGGVSEGLLAAHSEEDWGITLIDRS